MALKTQGTQFFIIDPDATGGPEVITVECAISIDGISASRDQLDTTCLESPARTYEAGLATPGQATVGLNFDPAVDSHFRVYNMWKEGIKTEMAVGYGDGTAIPGIDTDGLFDLPTTRSFVVLHDAYIADVPQTLALNALVNANVTIQLSGFPDIVRKA